MNSHKPVARARVSCLDPSRECRVCVERFPVKGGVSPPISVRVSSDGIRGLTSPRSPDEFSERAFAGTRRELLRPLGGGCVRTAFNPNKLCCRLADNCSRFQNLPS